MLVALASKLHGKQTATTQSECVHIDMSASHIYSTAEMKLDRQAQSFVPDTKQ